MQNNSQGKVTIYSDDETYVEKYTFDNSIDYSVNEIIHIKENSFNSIYRGVPRLKPAFRTMQLLGSMRKFQDNFFKNGAVPGLVLKSPNTLSEKIKERMLAAWSMRYNPNTGGRRPLILDGGLEIDPISTVNFRELDFQESIKANERIILEALGIPPILLDGGNNANIRPNEHQAVTTRKKTTSNQAHTVLRTSGVPKAALTAPHTVL